MLSGGSKSVELKADITGQGWGVLAEMCSRQNCASTGYTHSQWLPPPHPPETQWLLEELLGQTGGLEKPRLYS